MAPFSPQAPNLHPDGDILSSPSVSDQEDEYVVDKIIAQTGPEEGDYDETMYLVRWEGYSDERCTWEPRGSFLSNETLELWERDKEQTQILSQDEVKYIVRKMDAYAEEEEREKRSRARVEQPTGNGNPKPAASLMVGQDLAQTSRQKSHGSRASAGSRPMNAPSTTRAKLNSSAMTNIRTKSFQGIGIVPRACRSSHRPLLAKPKGELGMPFKNLSTQYRHQKAGRNEPAPDIAKIKLKSASEIIAAAGEDIAHILPSGESRPALFKNPAMRNPQILSSPLEELSSVQPVAADATKTPLAPEPSHTEAGFGNVQYMESAPASSVLAPFNARSCDVHYLPNGRYWLKGEILVHFTLRGEVMGDLRIGGLPAWFSPRLIALKVEHQILIDFQLVELWQYDALCRGRSNELLANAYITPFDDTEPALTEFAESLNYNNRAALWYHPDQPYVLVAYATASKDWHFLDGGHPFPPKCQIHLALRSSMPKPETLAEWQALEGPAAPAVSMKNTARSQAQRTSPNSPMQGVNLLASREISYAMTEQDMTANTTHSNARDRASSAVKGSPAQSGHSEPVRSTMSQTNELGDAENSGTLEGSTSPWLLIGNAEIDDRCFGSSRVSIECPLSPFSFTVPGGVSIDVSFQTRFGISYDYLTRPSVMPMSRKDAPDPKRARFYLAFPASCQSEMEALRALLSTHTLSNLICTSTDPQGWDLFRTVFREDHRGVIIFHDNYTSYFGLVGLAKLLRQGNVNVFNVCLRQLIPHHDEPVHVERLFPNGTAIFLTESAMTQQPVRILAILRWFSKMSQTKRGTWKIILIPNVRHWLRQTAMHAGMMQACFMDILTEISELSLGQPATYRILVNEESEAESLEGSDDEFGKPSLVVSPSNILAYDRCCKNGNNSTELERDQVLVEWFAGWAAQNAQRHRKFPAISSFSHESDKWGHIEVMDPYKYMLRNDIPLERPGPNDPPNQSPC